MIKKLRFWTFVSATLLLACIVILTVSVASSYIAKSHRSKIRRGETVVVNQQVVFWFDRFGAKVPLNQTQVDTILASVRCLEPPGVHFDIKKMGFFTSNNTCSLTVNATVKITSDATPGRKTVRMYVPGISAVSATVGAQPVIPEQSDFDGTNLVIMTFDVVP